MYTIALRHVFRSRCRIFSFELKIVNGKYRSTEVTNRNINFQWQSYGLPNTEVASGDMGKPIESQNSENTLGSYHRINYKYILNI
jgi:hypothetical protein